MPNFSSIILPLRWKIGLIGTLLSVSLTSICIFSLYQTAHETITQRISQTLLHMGRAGAQLLESGTREYIAKFSASTWNDNKITPGNSVTSPATDPRQNTASRQQLATTLQAVSLAIQEDLEGHREGDPNGSTESAVTSDNRNLEAFLLVPTTAHRDDGSVQQRWKLIASSTPQRASLTQPPRSLSELIASHSVSKPTNQPPSPESRNAEHNLLHGHSWAPDSTMSPWSDAPLHAFVPLVNEDDSLLAVFGISYTGVAERNSLRLLQILCYLLVMGSCALSIVGALYAAKRIGTPLYKLDEAARKIAGSTTGMPDVRVDIDSRDEFSALARTFNKMVANIREYTRKLEAYQHQLTTVMLDMHDGVGATLMGIVVNAGNAEKRLAREGTAQSSANVIPINHLARVGRSEIDFLLHSLDHTSYSFPLLFEEIQKQGETILTPSDIIFAVRTIGTTPDQPFSFEAFVTLQRIFRESFINIIKHSRAQHCDIKAKFSSLSVQFNIRNDGTTRIKDTQKDTRHQGGRGLWSMEMRVKRLGGSCSWNDDNGFNVEIVLPLPIVVGASEKSCES